MAAPYDAAARLAEGRPAVGDVEEYVLACRVLGYRHQDLTIHPAQVRDWYGSEDGLDLRALDADCDSLAAAAAAAQEAVRIQSDLVNELSGVWTGRGASSSREFTWRSGEAAATVGMAVRAAADAVATLRDDLWRAVDAKVAAVQVIDAKHGAQREDWLAAARTVTTGAGDLATASELVDLQVKPFVEHEIGSDWLAAMRTAAVSIGMAYHAAIARTSLGAPGVFDVPGHLGPRAESSRHTESTGGMAMASPATPAAAVAPASVMAGLPPATTTSATPFGGPSPGPAWSSPAPAVAPPSLDPAAAATAPAAGSSMPSMGNLGGAPSSLGSGVSGFGQQLADLIGGLVGSADGADGIGGPNESLDDPGDDDPFDEDETEDVTDDETEDVTDDETDEGETDEDPESEPTPEPAGETGEVAAEEPMPESPAAPTPVPPPAVPESVIETIEQKPCEIAADELPQVGE